MHEAAAAVAGLDEVGAQAQDAADRAPAVLRTVGEDGAAKPGISVHSSGTNDMSSAPPVGSMKGPAQRTRGPGMLSLGDGIADGDRRATAGVAHGREA